MCRYERTQHIYNIPSLSIYNYKLLCIYTLKYLSLHINILCICTERDDIYMHMYACFFKCWTVARHVTLKTDKQGKITHTSNGRVYVDIIMCIYTYVNIFIYMYMWTSPPLSIYTYTYMYTHVYKYIHVRICIFKN